MTSSIMDKITAALNMRALDTTPKHLNAENANGQDEYHTMFTKMLPNDVLNMNSPICGENTEIDHCNQSMSSLNDFIGGPIEKTEDHRSFNLGESDVDLNRSITATPADSSCGFHNTFSVLEKHLNNKRFVKLSQQQIEYLLLQNQDLAIHNDRFIDIPINDNRCLRTVDGLVNSSMNDSCGWDVGDDEFPSHFELEFEAMERLRSMWGDEAAPNIPNADDEPETSPALNDSNLIEDFYQVDGCNISAESSKEYIYHVAKRNGQLYIRVRRNLRLDQGK